MTALCILFGVGGEEGGGVDRLYSVIKTGLVGMYCKSMGRTRNS